MAITRTDIDDDDGSLTTGDVWNNAWKQEFYDQIDAADLELTAVAGAFTIAVAFAGAAVGVTYTSREAYATKKESEVTVHFRIVLSSKGSSTGSLSFTGLPYTCHGTYRGLGSVLVDNVASAGDAMRIYVDPGSTTILVRIQTATVNSAANDTHVTNTSVFSGTVTYVEA